jgi:hypothetical protein
MYAICFTQVSSGCIIWPNKEGTHPFFCQKTCIIKSIMKEYQNFFPIQKLNFSISISFKLSRLIFSTSSGRNKLIGIGFVQRLFAAFEHTAFVICIVLERTKYSKYLQVKIKTPLQKNFRTIFRHSTVLMCLIPIQMVLKVLRCTIQMNLFNLFPSPHYSKMKLAITLCSPARCAHPRDRASSRDVRRLVRRCLFHLLHLSPSTLRAAN